MTTIAILPEHAGTATTWRALAGEKESTARTAGEALDALTTQLSEDEISTLVIVQRLRPDRFFTADQRQRLGTLMCFRPLNEPNSKRLSKLSWKAQPGAQTRYLTS